MNPEENNRNRNNGSSWLTPAAVGVGLTALVGGGLYWLSRNRQTENQQGTDNIDSRQSAEQPTQSNNEVSTLLPSLANLISRVSSNVGNGQRDDSARGLALTREKIPREPIIVNLDSLLHDIYVRFIALKEDDFMLHYRVFDVVFLKLHNSMKNVDKYYNQYSSTVQVAGSHFDRLRIIKPDEFDIDITIGLPLNLRSDRYDPNNSDIIFENMFADYVKLKMGVQFERLPYRDNWDVNRTLYSWKDDNSYLLRSSFSDWFKSVGSRALREFEGSDGQRYVLVDGVRYKVGFSESGPALTIKLSGDGFKMDVDFVPTLEFPESRWPSNLRSIPSKYRNDKFLVTPKPIKYDVPVENVNRSWRLSLIRQERNLLYNTYNLRLIIRYLKKLRDTLRMDHIASYHVKTLFFWEVIEHEHEDNYWRQAPSKLFIIMVKKFQRALETGNIANFWYRDNNLIEKVPKHLLVGYAAKLKKLVQILDDPSQYKRVVDYMLTTNEQARYQDILAKII